jgi:hypothetical protein
MGKGLKSLIDPKKYQVYVSDSSSLAATYLSKGAVSDRYTWHHVCGDSNCYAARFSGISVQKCSVITSEPA